MEPLPLIPQNEMSPRLINLITNSSQDVQAFSDKLTKLQEGVRGAEELRPSDPTAVGWINDVESLMFQLEDMLDNDDDDAFNDLSNQVDALLATFNSSYFKTLVEEKPPPSSLNEPTSIFFGRDAVMEKLVTKLVSSSSSEDDQAMIIPIVGISGVGKTTLARLLLDHPRVVDHFGSLRAFVTLPNLPNPSDEFELTLSVLRALDDSPINMNYSQAHGINLENIVSNKPLLVVLDNVTTENLSMYESLPESLRENPRFKCVVITKSEAVATRMAGDNENKEECTIRLNLLSRSDCAKILNQIALVSSSKLIPEDDNEELQRLVSEIAKKCAGLPLAARAIASMLAPKSVIDEEAVADATDLNFAMMYLKGYWEDVVRSPYWDYTDDVENESFRWLNVCYADLPLELRGCFLSCNVFAKGIEIDVDELIRIWMARGYLDSTQSFDEVRLKGLGYVKRLVARSFLKEFNEVSMSVKVHDLMHDFATYVSNNKNGLIYDGKPQKQFNALRSRIPYTCVETMRFFVARNDELPQSQMLITQLKRVRHLVLSNCNLTELPSEIGELIHLRYLDVSQNEGITEFPETAYDLRYLQTLNLYRSGIYQLPDGVDKLESLRHLFLNDSDDSNTMEYPQGFEKLTKLWTLNVFDATPQTAPLLGGLNELHGSLKIKFRDIYTDEDIEEAKKANLSEKHGIVSLDLSFAPGLPVEVLEAAIPPPQIQSLNLSLQSWDPVAIPSWLTSAAGVLNNLKELRIVDLAPISELSPVGKLPLLEKLTIEGSHFVSLKRSFLGIGDEEGDETSSGGFPSLKELSFLTCQSWLDWEDVDVEELEDVVVFPCLEKLKVSGCWDLESLPSNLLCKAKALRIVACASDLGEKSNISQILPNAEIRWVAF